MNGELAVARAIGDADYKGRGLEQHTWRFPNDHPGTFSADLVVPHPSVLELELTPDDQFLILACDGLWDVLPEDEVRLLVAAFRCAPPPLTCAPGGELCAEADSSNRAGTLFATGSKRRAGEPGAALGLCGQCYSGGCAPGRLASARERRQLFFKTT